MGKTQHSLALLALAFSLAACARQEIGEAKYAPEDCRRVALLDGRVGGERLRGAEDMALDRAGGRLFISAYDRRGVEKAARKRRKALPQGGVYAVSLAELFNRETSEITVQSLADPAEFAGGLRPHGLAYDAANHELVFINRTYAFEGGKWKMTPRLQRIGANGEAYVGRAEEAHCAANDVAADEQGAVVTFDHGACGFGAGVENVFRLKRSGVARSGEKLFDKAAFANGLVHAPSGGLILAATRENALVALNEGYSETARYALPGGPDNLTIAYDGDIVAGVHPSLFRLMLNRKFGIGAAPSRIVKADPDTGAVEILFDDPKGTLFSAATVAVETEQGLVAGSATDEGLLVCEAAS